MPAAVPLIAVVAGGAASRPRVRDDAPLTPETARRFAARRRAFRKGAA